MAYELHPSHQDREELNYRLEAETNPGFTMDLILRNGRPGRGMDAAGCSMMGIEIPELLADCLPKRIIVDAIQRDNPPDYAKAGGYGMYIVSDKIRDIVCALEPDLHQFIEIPEALDSRGKPISKKYFFLNVRIWVDAVDIQNSKVEIVTEKFNVNGLIWESQRLAEKLGAAKDRHLILKKDVIAKLHLWRGDKMGLKGHYFCSNQLHDVFISNGVTNFRYRRLDES